MTKVSDIIGFEALYYVTNEGKVFSRAKEWIANGVKFSKPETELKQFKNKWGYCMATLQKSGFSKNCSVHRLVAIAFIPNPENKPEVNHLDGDKTNNNDWNLKWATESENQLHAYETGLKKPYDRPTGTANIRSKLTDQQVEEIRRSNLSARKLAPIYGVHYSTVGHIKTGKRYPIK